MGSVDLEKDMAAPTESEAREESASMEEENAQAVVKSVDGVCESEGKSESVSPNEELNSKTSHDVLVEDGEKGVSDVSVNESFDVDAASMAVEPPMSITQVPVAVSSSEDLDVDPSLAGDGLNAMEKVESWDLSEAVAKNAQEIDDKEELRPNIPDEGLGEDIDAPAECVETSVEAPTSVEVTEGLSVPSGHVEDIPKDSQGAEDEGETLAAGSGEVPSAGLPEGPDGVAQDFHVEEFDSEVLDSHTDGIDSEAQDTQAKEIDSEAQGPHAEEVDGDAQDPAISVPLEEGSAPAETVPPSSDGAEEESAEMKHQDISEEDKGSPLEGDVIGSEGPHPVCVGGVERVVSELHYAPVEEVHELVEANTIEQSDEEPAESESMAVHSDSTEEEPAAINFEDVPELPTSLEKNVEENGSYDEVPAEGLLNRAELPIEDVSDAGTNADYVDKTAESDITSVPSDDVKTSVEAVSDDVSAVPSTAETDDQEGASSEIPAPEPSGNVEDEGESAPPPSDDVEEKPVDVVSEDVSAVLSTGDTDDQEGASSEIPALESSGNVEDEGESAPPPSDDVEEKPVDAVSEDVSAVPSMGETDDQEDASSEIPAPEPSGNVEDEGESTPPPSDDVEEKPVDAVSEDVSAVPSTGETDDQEDVSSEIPATESSGNVEDEGESVPSPSEDKKKKLVEPFFEDASSEIPVPESSGNGKDEGESAPPPSDDVEEKSVETVSEDASSEIPAPEPSVNIEDEDESAPPPSDKVEEKPVDVVSEDVSAVPSAAETDDQEGAISEIPAPESSGNVKNEGDGVAEEEIYDNFKVGSAQPEESSTNLESLSATANDAEDKEIEVISNDLSDVTAAISSESGENEDGSPEISSQESADHALDDVVVASVKDVHESTDVTMNDEPVEQSTEPKSLAPFSDGVEDTSVEDKSEDVVEMNASQESVVTTTIDAEANADDTIAVATTSDSVDREVASIEIDGSNGAINTPTAEADDEKPDMKSSNLEFAAALRDPSSPPGEVKPGVSFSEMKEATHTSLPAEEEPLDYMESLIPRQEQSDEGAAVNEEETVADFKETDAADHSPEESLSVTAFGDAPDDSQDSPLVEPSERTEDSGVAGVQTDRSLDVKEFPQATEAELHNKGVPVEFETNAGDTGASERGDVIAGERPDSQSGSANKSEMTKTPLTAEELPIDQFIVSVPIEPATDISSDATAESRDEDSASAIATEAPETNEVASFSSDVNLNVDFNNIDFSETPASSDATQVSSDDLSKIEASDNNANESIGDGSYSLQMKKENEEAASAAPNSVEDVSHLLQTEMTDEEIKLAALRDPESGIDVSEESVLGETPASETEVIHDKSMASLANDSQKSFENEVETTARDFNFGFFRKAFTSTEAAQGESGESDHKVTPYLATAVAALSGEEEETSNVSESDAVPEEASSPPSVPEDKSAPKSYNLDEVATSLHDVAEKTLEEAKTSDIGQNQESIVQSVAQIVIEDSAEAADSSEYISRVVQDVAQLAQDVGESDPNILPDTVARVWDHETASSPENEVSQPKGSSGLGTMVSLFVIWCVSLCATRLPSKHMPKPALKLAAEEVTSVLNSNSQTQPAASNQETGTTSR